MASSGHRSVFPNGLSDRCFNDKENWTTVYEKKRRRGSAENDLSQDYKACRCKGRYVRFMGTLLRDDDQTHNDGLLMRLAELEIYSEDN